MLLVTILRLTGVQGFIDEFGRSAVIVRTRIAKLGCMNTIDDTKVPHHL